MKLYLRTFGCRANQYDSEAVRAMVEAEGTTIVDAPEEADVAVFNSCAVTADAVADLRQHVRRASRRNPALRSVVMGCAAALPGDAATELAELPGVHALHVEGSRVRFDVDTSNLDAVVRRLSELGVRSLVSQPPTLEELFLRHYGEELANETALVDRLRDRS